MRCWVLLYRFFWCGEFFFTIYYFSPLFNPNHLFDMILLFGSCFLFDDSFLWFLLLLWDFPDSTVKKSVFLRVCQIRIQWSIVLFSESWWTFVFFIPPSSRWLPLLHLPSAYSQIPNEVGKFNVFSIWVNRQFVICFVILVF